MHGLASILHLFLSFTDGKIIDTVTDSSENVTETTEKSDTIVEPTTSAYDVSTMMPGK